MNIFYISPYDRNSPPNIGGAINKMIRKTLSSPDDWFVLQDYDCMFLLPDSKSQLEQILWRTKYDILGPRMNRLGNDYQLSPGMFDETDIRKHIALATYLSDEYWLKVKKFSGGPLAAACLCFKRSTWERLGGFDEHSLAFDTLFCHRAELAGMKLGIMEGIYIWHTYRLSKAVNNIDHLL